MIEPATGAASQKAMKKVFLALVVFFGGAAFGGWSVYYFWGKGVLVSEWELKKDVARCEKKLDEFYSKTMR